MEENGTAKGQEEDLEFMELAKQISSTLDPDLTKKLKQVEYINIFGKHGMFGNEELIPVGSCIDGSKINLPNDSGDIDVLIVPNKIILKESLFDYDKRYPAFLHIRINEEHEKYFRTVKNPVSGIYLPATVLKQVHGSFFFLCRLFVMAASREGISKDGRFLNVTRTSAVGKELITLNAETLGALGVTNIPYSLSISKLGQYGSHTLMGIMNLSYNDDGKASDRETQNLKSNSQSLVETLNKFLDMAETKQDDCKTDDRNSNDISRERQPFCLDDNMSALAVDPVTETVGVGVRNEFSFVTNDGYVLTNTQKKGKSSLENDFAQEGLVPVDLISGESKPIQISNETNIKIDNPSQDAAIMPLTKRRLSEENPDSMNRESQKSTEIATELENAKPKHPFSRLKSTDFVPAYKFEGWPRPADEWLARPRKWPAKTVVRQVLECGCHVVAKRPLSTYQDSDSSVTDEIDAYFRLSFSESEIILARNMKERQMLCWRVLKAYQKSFFTSEKKLLTSYHWKNVVFWIGEGVGDLFWESPETFMLNINRVKNILSKENKSKHTDTVFEEISSGFLRQFHAMCDSNECEDEKLEQFHGTFTKLTKKARTDEEANSSDAIEDMGDFGNSFKEMFLTRIEMIADSMMGKENGSEVFKSAAEFLDTLAYKVKASGDCGEHSDEKKVKVASDFCSHLASSFLELSKEGGDDSTVLAGIHKCSKVFVEAKQLEYGGNKETGELNRVQPTLLAAFPKFIEAIQKSVSKGYTDFSLPAEFRRIINSTSQEIEAVLENKNERNKNEMDIDLD